jgi:RND superfamily putative drug exporter
VFGLSTDYGVFLLARIKEARDRGAGASDAIAAGVERTGRIVTAAALLFAVAFGAFVASEIVVLEVLGLGAGLAVLLDATVIRALLMPSLLHLLGRRSWWAPVRLRRLHALVRLSET